MDKYRLKLILVLVEFSFKKFIRTIVIQLNKGFTNSSEHDKTWTNINIKNKNKTFKNMKTTTKCLFFAFKFLW
jgi:hypothetical protein